MLERADGLGSMNFSLRYNPAVVRANKAEVGDLARGSLFRANTQEAGIIHFGVAVQSGQEITGDGPVAYVEFTAVGPEGTSTNLTLVDPFTKGVGGSDVGLHLQHGLLVIEAKTKGEYDGDKCVTFRDALAALKMSVRELTEDLNLDVDDDGRVTAEDARLILRDAVAAIGTCPLPAVTGVAPDLDFFGELAALHSRPVTATFDSAADSLSLADGSAIDVPAGAFSAATELSVVIIDLLFENYLVNPPEARIYVLSTEDDIVLGAPLVLEVPKPSDSVNVTELVDGEWLPVDVPAGPTTRVEIDHFSDNTISVSDKPSGKPELKLPAGETWGGYPPPLISAWNSPYFGNLKMTLGATSAGGP